MCEQLFGGCLTMPVLEESLSGVPVIWPALPVSSCCGLGQPGLQAEAGIILARGSTGAAWWSLEKASDDHSWASRMWGMGDAECGRNSHLCRHD
jgi:hypothetical protein